ncbi:YihY/virulence factor BrkB family protein [Halorussus salinus]|uniref:YihY/virulence factor BrkB family protein n=1 Tax=Halorussus salinus TaxID=1364935 RepID=UPI0010923DA9|nr:YihY/virulence factor BrkB family protein [Halorussus salinus]
MGGRGRELWRATERVVRASWREVHDQNITFMAGSIAYHAFVSMLPLLLFVLVVLTTVGNEEFTASVAAVTEPFLTAYARDLLVESLDVATARTGVSVVGAVTLLWGVSKIFRGLDVAFSQIYGTASNKSVRAQIENALVVVVALGLAVVAFLVAGAVAARVPDLPYPALSNPLLLAVGLAVAFFPIYYVFPDADVTPREVLPGVVFAAVGWTAMEAAFQAYVLLAGRYEAVYGTLGSAFILLIWLYFSSLVLLVGAVVNAVLAGRIRDERALAALGSSAGDATERGSVGDGRTDRGAAQVNGGASGRRPPSESVSTGDRTPAPERPSPADRVRTMERPRSDADRRRADGRPEADADRLREELRRLEADNARLRRVNDALNRRLARRRSVVRRAKQWLFDR